MLEEDREILQQFVDRIVPELMAVAGDSFGSTIESHVYDDGFVIDASPFISVLWEGRRPTSPGAKRGNPSLVEALLDWIKDKGIQPKNQIGASMSRDIESMAWAMSKSIHLYGTALYQAGGKPNIFESVINEERINALLSLFSESYKNRVSSDVFKVFEP